MFVLRVISLLLIIACPLRSLAGVAPTPGTEDVKALFDTADLVCSCSVVSVRPNGSEWIQSEGSRVLLRHKVASISALQRYKGASSTNVFDVEFDGDLLSTKENAILFLKSIAPSVYVVTDPFVGSTPFSVLPPPQGEGIAGLEGALARLAQNTNRDDKLNAMRLLEGFPPLSSQTMSIISSNSTSSDPDVAYTAFAVLLKTGEGEYVKGLRNYVRAHPTDNAPVSILSIGSELARIRDDTAISSLQELSGSRLLSLRIGAMQSLRAIRSRAAAPAIVKRLDDSDGYVRYLAVMTLAETFGKYGNYAPNMGLFDRNPDLYVGLWKSWWEQERRLAITGLTQ